MNHFLKDFHINVSQCKGPGAVLVNITIVIACTAQQGKDVFAKVKNSWHGESTYQPSWQMKR